VYANRHGGGITGEMVLSHGDSSSKKAEKSALRKAHEIIAISGKQSGEAKKRETERYAQKGGKSESRVGFRNWKKTKKLKPEDGRGKEGK